MSEHTDYIYGELSSLGDRCEERGISVAETVASLLCGGVYAAVAMYETEAGIQLGDADKLLICDAVAATLRDNIRQAVARQRRIDAMEGRS